MTRQEIETALDAGRLYFQSPGMRRPWRCRRNGQTITWKRDPARFRIPIKAGFRDCGWIDQDNLGNGFWRIEE